MERILKFGLPLVLCVLVGGAVGRLLHFTLWQCAAMSFSLCLLALWLLSVMGTESVPVFGHPAVGVVTFALFAVLFWFAFFSAPTGGPTVDPPIGAAPVRFPRFLSACMAALPAIPYGVASLAGLISGRAD